MRIKNRYKNIIYPCISNSVFAVNDRKNLKKTNLFLYNSHTYTNHNLCQFFVFVYSHNNYNKHEFQYLHFENLFLNETDWVLHNNKFVKASEIK
jgi:hypothetical protein